MKSALPSNLFLLTVEQAVSSSSDLMGKLLAAVRTSLQQRQKNSTNLLEREVLGESIKQLQANEDELCKLYPITLREAFATAETPSAPSQPGRADVHFDQLELMDEAQVQETVILARTQQVAMLAAESSLADLNTLVCSAMGLKTVNPDRNPFRPEIYVSALKLTLEKIGVSSAVKLDWLAAMSAVLGKALSQLYTEMAMQLRQQGVRAAGYSIIQSPVARAYAAAGRLEKSAGSGADDAVLTLDKLRRLLSGELPVATSSAEGRLESFARQFSQEFEGGSQVADSAPADFAATVPAAYEALTEMKQTGQVVDRLTARLSGKSNVRAAGSDDPNTARARLRSSASNVAQALSLEVVSLMVDNMTRDTRLLQPLREIIRQLEPALMRLALVDPRFFNNKLHPARQLLEEMTQRSLAFESAESTGCSAYLSELKESLASLEFCDIENADPFEQVLNQLRTAWLLQQEEKSQKLEDAVKALKHVEQRNFLAEKIAAEIKAHPDSVNVPKVVVDFLCGPWAQVVAQSRLLGGSDSRTADKYQALISAMLWSAHPELANKNISKLTRVVPLLISTLRDGLETIAYPAIKISEFLEALMGLHQLAFNQARKPKDQVLEKQAVSALQPKASVGAGLLDDSDPWIAPAEALASNFIALPEASPELVSVQLVDLPLGTWIELMVSDQWVRSQLTWSSPHGTLFLFTSAFGSPQSMTRRTADKYLSSGKLRVISEQPVVDEALNAVARTAMRNSVDTQI